MLSIVIEQKNLSQKKLTTTITYVNPSQSITNTQLKNFAQLLVSLTTNSYVDAELVDKTDIDDTREAGKTEGIITIGTFSNQQATVTYNGDGTLQLANANNATLTGTILTVGASGGSGILYADATSNYTAAVTVF